MMNIEHFIQVIHKIFWSLIQMMVYPFTTYLERNRHDCLLDKRDCLSAAIIKDMTEKLRDVLQDKKTIKEDMKKIDTKMDALVMTLNDFQIQLKKLVNDVVPLMLIPEETDTKMNAIVKTMNDFQIQLKRVELVGQKLNHNSLQKSSRIKRVPVSKRKGNRPKQVNCNLLNYDEKSHLDLPENLIPMENTGAIKKKQAKLFFASMKQKIFRKKKEKFEESRTIASSSSEIASLGDNWLDSGSVNSIAVKDISKKVGKKGLSLKSVLSSCRKKEKK